MVYGAILVEPGRAIQQHDMDCYNAHPISQVGCAFENVKTAYFSTQRSDTRSTIHILEANFKSQGKNAPDSLERTIISLIARKSSVIWGRNTVIIKSLMGLC